MKSPNFPTIATAASRRRKARYALAARSFLGISLMSTGMLFVDGSAGLFALSVLGVCGGLIGFLSTCIASGISTEHDMVRDG